MTAQQGADTTPEAHAGRASPQQKDGTAGAAVVGGWNQIKNIKA